jgi:hypothetical protein
MNVKIMPQPDDETCGPTSLHAVYTYFNRQQSLSEVIANVKYLKDGGTLAVFLGLDALRNGMKATTYSYNLKLFDPSWSMLDNNGLIDKLQEQLKYKEGKKFAEATRAYIQFLDQGGVISFDNLTFDLLKKYFDRKIPVLAGLSATFLYNTRREYSLKNKSIYDDLRGEPMGHFVVLYDSDEDNLISVADPYAGNPISLANYYKVDVDRLINSIMLGIVTYDANLLIIHP